ncbi:hypothetical protein T492DRAFT_887610, partial [Pavlovales sp. CCMP2436]
MLASFLALALALPIVDLRLHEVPVAVEKASRLCDDVEQRGDVVARASWSLQKQNTPVGLLVQSRVKRAAATAPPEGGAAWLATMMLLFATRGGGPHAETPLKATKVTTTMLLPAAAAV